MPKFSRPLTKEQLAHRAAKKKIRPGGRQQPKGTQPYVHMLPDKPAWKPIENRDKMLARALGLPTGRLNVLGPELQNVKPPGVAVAGVEPKVKPVNASAIDKFKAMRVNGKEVKTNDDKA